MDSIEKKYNINSNKLNDGDIIKIFVADEKEINDVLKFEQKLLKLLNSLRSEDLINKDMELAKIELNKKGILPKLRKKFFTDAIKIDEEELEEIQILKNILSNQVITKDNDFKYLLCYILKYSSKNIIKTYIKSTKSLNITTPFLNCFDEKGNVIEENILNLDKIINKMYKNIELSKFKNFKIEKFTNLFFTSEQKKVLKKRIEKEKQELEEKERLERENRTSVVYKYDTKEYSKYVDSFGNLKKMALIDGIDKVLDDIKNVQGLTSDDLKKYKEQFKNMKVQQEVKSLFVKSTQKEKEILNEIIENEALFESAKKIILDPNYKNLDIINKKNVILEEFIDEEQIEITENPTSNLFVFPYDEFIENEFETITKKANIGKDVIKKALRVKFEALEKNSVQEMQSKFKKVVHRLLEGKDNPFYLCNNTLMGFRFGHRVNKIGYTILPIPEENKKLLKEKYNCDDNFQVLAILGFGNVKIEEENSMYDRIKSTARSNEKYYRNLLNIFSKPFTNESFKIACDYIDQGAATLNNKIEFNYLNSNEQEKNKKVI